jgi:hypothetical protein
MTQPTYFTRPEIILATRGEWITRGGEFRFGPDSPIVLVHADALAGLQRAGGLVVVADSPAKASNKIRRMQSDEYDAETHGTIAAATRLVAVDLFHTFDVWGRGADHKVTAESMRPKVTQTLRRIIARLPDHGYRPHVAVQASPAGLAVTAYRLA